MANSTKKIPTPIYDPLPWWPCWWWDPLPGFLKLTEDQKPKLAALQETMHIKMSEIYAEAAEKLTTLEQKKNDEAQRIMGAK